METLQCRNEATPHPLNLCRGNYLRAERNT